MYFAFVPYFGDRIHDKIYRMVSGIVFKIGPSKSDMCYYEMREICST